MPREIVHWKVARAAYKGLSLILREKLPEISEDAIFLGAIAHDAPYYLVSKVKDTKDFTQVAEYLHGTDGEDTYEPIRRLFEKVSLARKSGDEYSFTLGFLLGFLSHLVTDSIFHPPIIYLTGDYYDQDPVKANHSRRKHRALETSLDNQFVGEDSYPTISKVYSRFIAKAKSQELEAIYTAITPNGLDMIKSRKNWELSFQVLGYLQVGFRSRIFGSLLKMFCKKHPTLSEYEALFNANRRKVTLSISLPFEWRDPLSGSEHRSSWSDLIKISVNRTLLLWSELISSLIDEEQPEFLKEVGPSLSFNLPGIKRGAVIYTTEEDKEW